MWLTKMTVRLFKKEVSTKKEKERSRRPKESKREFVLFLIHDYNVKLKCSNVKQCALSVCSITYLI